jgi:hypothetical protein
MKMPASTLDRIEFDPDTLRGNRLRRFYSYWDGRRGTRAMPARRDIDPVDIPWMLGFVTLHEVLPDGGFRFRVDATHTANVFGVDMTGRTLDEYPSPEVREMIRASLTTVVESRVPLRRDLDFGAKFQNWRYERLILPLSDDGERVNMLFSAIDAAPTAED